MAMVPMLERALAALASLPEADQEQIGRSLLSHVEKLKDLRARIDAGVSSLEAGQGAPRDVGDLVQNLNGRHARR
jgi:hypothetical protein